MKPVILVFRTMVELEKIFGSRTRVKLFRLLLTQPEKEYFVREIAREIEEQINSVRRELNSLEKIGIVKSETRERKKYYSANPDFSLFNELRSLIMKSRLTSEHGFIQDMQRHGQLKYLVLTGYFVNDGNAQVDVFIVGNISRAKLDRLIEEFKDRFGQQLRYTLMNHDEFVYRKEVTDKFLYSIINSDKIVLVDKLKG